MRTFALAACFALSVALVPVLRASADDKKDVAAKGTLPANFGKLGLSDEQKAKIYSVQAKFRAKLEDLKKQLADIEKEQKTAIFDVLTDAQKSRLKEMALEKAGGSGNKPDKSTDKPSDKK